MITAHTLIDKALPSTVNTTVPHLTTEKALSAIDKLLLANNSESLYINTFRFVAESFNPCVYHTIVSVVLECFGKQLLTCDENALKASLQLDIAILRLNRCALRCPKVMKGPFLAQMIQLSLHTARHPAKIIAGLSIECLGSV